MIKNVEYNELLGVCLDTCHLNDAGYDLSQFDELLEEFDEKIGLDRLLVVHVNDSKNERGAHKDRHENIGYGQDVYKRQVIIKIMVIKKVNNMINSFLRNHLVI